MSCHYCLSFTIELLSIFWCRHATKNAKNVLLGWRLLVGNWFEPNTSIVTEVC